MMVCVMWLVLKQLMSYQGLDNLGHWDDCGAAQGGGTYAAISSTAVDENFAQIELEKKLQSLKEDGRGRKL